MTMGRSDTSDAGRLAGYTLIPRIVWQAVCIFIALICLWIGARRLLAL